MRTKRAGNMTATREGKENLFELNRHRMYVAGLASIHPKTGKPYDVEWRPIPAMPDVLLFNLLIRSCVSTLGCNERNRGYDNRLQPASPHGWSAENDEKAGQIRRNLTV